MRNDVLAMMITADRYIEGPNKEFVPPNLKQIDAKTMDTGAVILRYAPDK